LELTTSLNTPEFLQAFDRFVARRGTPSTIISDNAKTFEKASGIVATSKGILWKFITPRAPWHGGFWERLVRTVKVALRKSLCRKSIEFEQLRTILCKIEGVINDRPLTYLEDSTSPQALCPSHFLLGRRSIENNILIKSSEESNLSAGFEDRNQLLTEFWDRWQYEYLPLLNVTFKSSKAKRPIREGDVILLEAEGKRKHLWPIARVDKLYKGTDGRIRTAAVICNGKMLRRPIQKLYFLEQSVADMSHGGKSLSYESDGQSETNCSETSDVCSETNISDTNDVDDVDREIVTSRTRSRTICPPVKYGW